MSHPPPPPSPGFPGSPVASSFMPLFRWSDASPKSPDVHSKGVWSEAEHGRFLDALKRFPQGPWKAITAHIGTRSIRQVQTHAQKYMEKVQRRARGLKTAHPRLVRRDHRIDEDVKAWWARETEMLASSSSSTSRPKPTTRRRRQHRRRDSDDTTVSTTSSSSLREMVQEMPDTNEAKTEVKTKTEDDGLLNLEPLPLWEALACTSPIPTLEECLAVVCECLAEPLVSTQLDFVLPSVV